MKFLFLLEYKYIFCLPSRRSGQITVRALEIVYSFCSFVCSSSFTWQHSPDSSFSWVCAPQHFVLSTDTFHTLHVHSSYNYKLHTYRHVLLKNNDNHSYNFYTLSSLLKKSQNFLSFALIHLIILLLLNIVEESV